MAIPAGGVLLAAAGGILAYAGFTGKNPLEALKDVASGSPTGIAHSGSSALEEIGAGVIASGDQTAILSPGIANLPAALAHYKNDRYSQLRRWQDGYSDCSSFIGKGLKLIGIKPPGYSTTTSYLTSRSWKQVPEASAKAGDIACNTSHVVCCTGGGNAIGQENPRRNVQTGTVKSLMSGTGSYIILRYVSSSGSSGGKVTLTNV